MKKSYSFMVITFLVMFFISISNVSASSHSVTTAAFGGTYNGQRVTNLVSFNSNYVDFNFYGFRPSSSSNFSSFNTGQLNFGISPSVTGNAYVSFTSIYQSANEETITLKLNDSSCNIISNSVLEVKLNQPVVQIANFSCVTNIRPDYQYINIGGNSISSFAINNILDISYNETDLLNKLEELRIAINNISVNQQNITDIKNNTNEVKNNTKETNDLIKNDNTSGAESSADDLKNNSAFQDDTGLSAIISMPLTFVNSLTNTCQPINLTIPYMDADVSIPCMQSVITNKMPLLANLIKIVINGFIVYRILLDIFQIVRNAKNPEDDRIEVLDL